MLEFQALDGGYAVVQRGGDPCGQLRTGRGGQLRTGTRGQFRTGGQLRTGTRGQLHTGTRGCRCSEPDLLVVGSSDRQGR
jgi:hypothetical protein